MLPRRLFLDSLLDNMEDEGFNKMMKCDIYEEDNVYHIVVDIPGYKKEDIDLEFDKGYLKIAAKHNEEEKDNKKYMRKERIYTSSCERSFYLGEDVDEESIKAEFKDGILSVSIPKKEVEDKTKKIINID